MKIVINDQFGGFNISPRAIQRLAELKGRPCYFFQQHGPTDPYLPVYPDNLDEMKSYYLTAFDIPNPNEVIPGLDPQRWYDISMDERQAHNALYRQHQLDSRPDDRADLDLIRVVEELGAAANGSHATLKIVEIPDGVDWQIDEYDGSESIHEKHRSWN